jgi:O-acetylhomoserine/O-acetylserine sulfhydrylase-like pyridoxal-dependent enzyme
VGEMIVTYEKYKWEHEAEYKKVNKEQEALSEKRFQEKYKEIKYKNDLKDRLYIEGEAGK